MSTSPAALFGRLAIEAGFVTEEQVDACLRIQVQLGGKHHLGALLVHRGFLSEAQLGQVLALQREHQATVHPFAPPRAGAAAQTMPTLDAPVPPPASTPAFLAGSQAARPDPRARGGPGPAGSAGSGGTAAASGGTAAASGGTAAAASRVPALLEAAEKRGASDVHFHPGAPLSLRIGGRLLVTTQAPLEHRELEPHLLAVLSAGQREQLGRELSLDLVLVTPGGLRCRANLYLASTGLHATFRIVRRAPSTLEELGLPSQLASFTAYSQGLVLVCGLAGSGKSTTLAALVNLIAEEHQDHILCLEDPIEIVHPAKKALVNQRQVGRDTESFARALRGALREDPDVIVVGELRDRETIALAVTAAETGHLVLGTMNTATSSRAIARILGAFPPSQQAQVRAMVSESLHGVITQRLVPALDGGRAAALEVLVITPAMANLIRDDKLFQVRSQMQSGRQLGMRTLDESLRELVAAGRVSVDEARRVAENPASIVAPAAVPASAGSTGPAGAAPANQAASAAPAPGAPAVRPGRS